MIGVGIFGPFVLHVILCFHSFGLKKDAEDDVMILFGAKNLTYTVFGWGDFRGMENIEWKTLWKTVFFTVWEREENRESGKPGRKFSLPGPQISSPQIKRKSLSGKLMKKTLSIMPSGIKLKKKKKKNQRDRTGEKKRVLETFFY